MVHWRVHGGLRMYGAKELAESFRTVRRNTIQIAEDIPEDQYGFKAAPDVKSVAALLAHIAVSPGWQIEVHRQRISAIDFAFFGGRAPQVAAEEKALGSKAHILEALTRGGDEFSSMVERMTPEFLAE